MYFVNFGVVEWINVFTRKDYREFTAQKLEYIHNNPVDAGIVEKAEEYIYTGAIDYYSGKQCGLIKIEYLL